MPVKSIISAYYSAKYSHKKKPPRVSRQEVAGSFHAKSNWHRLYVSQHRTTNSENIRFSLYMSFILRRPPGQGNR